tara:strand:+ start:1735 stop:2235 length:501 start_codon:yes stop_codon:yes gene_type:complete
MKKLILMLCSITIISCGEKKKNENTLNKTENHFGTIEKGDQKSLAAQSFSKAYIANDLASVSGLFTKDAKIMINDSDITFDQLVAGFSEGFKYYENIHHMDTDTYTMYYDDGEIFTNYWYTWHGKSKKTGEDLMVRGYSWMKWEGDKISEMYNAFDPTAYNAGMVD